MISHDPLSPVAGLGISKIKKLPISESGAGAAKYTASVETTRIAARIFVESSTAL